MGIKSKPKLPVFVVKAIWPNTAVKLRIRAKDEQEALDKANRMIHRFEGRELCLLTTILSQRQD